MSQACAGVLTVKKTQPRTVEHPHAQPPAARSGVSLDAVPWELRGGRSSTGERTLRSSDKECEGLE